MSLILQPLEIISVSAKAMGGRMHRESLVILFDRKFNSILIKINKRGENKKRSFEEDVPFFNENLI